MSRSVATARPSARAALRLLLAATLIAVALFAVRAPAGFAAGLGNSGALNELTEPEAESTTTKSTTTASTTSTSSSSTSGTVLIVALGAAVLLLGGIAFVILRDAHRVAPAGEADLLERPARDTAAMQRKRRAKAKAARQQRKRNR